MVSQESKLEPGEGGCFTWNMKGALLCCNAANIQIAKLP